MGRLGWRTGTWLTSAGVLALPLALIGLSRAAAGIYSAMGPFWTMPPVFLTGAAAAAGIAAVNSIGNLGGFAGPYTVGNMAKDCKWKFSCTEFSICNCNGIS